MSAPVSTPPSPPSSAVGFYVRWDRLVRHVLQGGVIPFLGAGVSRDARTFNDSPPVVPTVDKLRKNMVESLAAWLSAPPESSPALREELGLKGVQTVSDADFARLAEVLTWYAGPLEPVTSTGIQDYAHLLPLPAHRAIARLAREGLIDEVISTNYDCCLERAWRNTLPADRRLNDDPTRRDDRKGWHPAVIRTLGEHRQRGSRRECPHGFPALRVYKINGCAERLERQLSQANNTSNTLAAEQACRDIILTEPQLRDFGARSWARDLLRDRARSTHLLFSGFGSDEAQVRFTMLDLLAELSQDGEGRQGEPALWDEGNAPWIQGFGENLSYPQAQILRGYRDVRSDRSSGWPLSTNTINAFLGGDARALTVCPQTGLTADLFWTRLHQAVWGRLLVKHTSRQSAIHSWLSEMGVDAQAWLAQLRSWLYTPTPDVPGYPDDDGFADLTSRIGRVPELIEDPGLSPSCKPIDQRPACPPFWRWLAAINGIDITRNHRGPESLCPAEQDYYLAWRDDPVLIALVLLLAWLALGEREQPLPGPTANSAQGLWLPIKRAGTQPTWILVRAEGADLPDISGHHRNVLIVSVPRRSGRGESASILTLARESAAGTRTLKQRKAVRQEPLSVTFLLRELRSRENSTPPSASKPSMPALMRTELRRIVAAERVDLHRSRLISLRRAS